jgi:hypothetical protein
VGKIADAWVAIGAKTNVFTNALANLKNQFGQFASTIGGAFSSVFQSLTGGFASILTQMTGIQGSGQLFVNLLAAGFGKAILAAGLLAAAIAATAYVLDQLYSRSKDQIFADSVAGLTGGFRGLAEEIKHTDEKIKAIMEKDATGGSGGWWSISTWKAIGERVVGIETLTSQIARNMNNAATASKLFADNMVKAAIAAREQSQTKAGASMFAGLRRTAAQQEEERVNAEAMKRVLDEQGGTRVAEKVLDYLRKNPSMVPSGVAPMAEAQRVAGALESGDIEATRMFGDLFDVAGQKAKIAVDEWMKAIPATNELAKLEQDRIENEKDGALFQFDQWKRQQDLVKMVAQEQAKAAQQRRKEAEEMNKATEQASKEKLKLEDEQSALAERLAQFQADRAEQLNRSFQFSGLADARDRLFMAAQDSKKDELTASKMQGEIDKVVKALDKLQMKWGMV